MHPRNNEFFEERQLRSYVCSAGSGTYSISVFGGVYLFSCAGEVRLAARLLADMLCMNHEEVRFRSTLQQHSVSVSQARLLIPF